MLPVTDAFLPAIVRPHTIVTYATAINGATETELPIVGFSVTVDSASQYRRTLDLTVAGLGYIPTTATSALAPNGQRVRISRGIQYVDGAQEIKYLGTFRIDSWTANPITGSVQVQGSSLECLLDDDRFESPRSISGSSAQTVIRDLCEETAPDVDVVVTATFDAICPTFVAEEDRLGAIREIARAIGCDFRADAFGRFELRDAPTIDQYPVWTIDAATEYTISEPVATTTFAPGALVGSERGESREGVYNAVTARGENLGDDYPPVQSTVTDLNPLSATYWVESPTEGQRTWGKRRRYYSSPLLTSNSQARKAATAILAASVGAAKTLSLSAICNPALEDGDVIYHGGELFLADSFSIGSSPGDGMDIQTRSSKVPNELE